MTTSSLRLTKEKEQLGSERAGALADRLEKGAQMLAEFAASLTPAEWTTKVPHDGRKVGVMVHHVGNMYPIEIKFALMVAGGTPIAGVTMADIDSINAGHAVEFDKVTKEDALDFLRINSQAAAWAIRALTDEELDRAVTISLYGDAPLTCQFFIEDHALRHSYHHFARIRKALNR